LKYPLLKIPALLAPLLLLAACEGDPGQPGFSYLPHDLYPPTAEIILPLASRPLYESAVVEVLVSDDDSVARTEFLVDGLAASAGAITPLRPPSEYILNSSSLSPGSHTLQLLAWDRVGKVGESSMLYLNRAVRPANLFDTLRFFADSPNQFVDWKLPSDSLTDFTALATRFVLDRPCILYSIGVKLHRHINWAGTQLYVDLMSSKDGYPDTLINRKTLELRSAGGGEEYNDWLVRTYRGIPMSGEFFAAVRISETITGDTMAVETDTGLWRNGHGMMMGRDGVWKPFVSGRGRLYNPLIYAMVTYP